MVGEAPREPQANATGVTNRIPFPVHPMLATLAAKPFDRAGWVFEEKYDGDRILAYKEGDRVRLLSRNGKDRTDRFPRIAATIRSLPRQSLLLDGEDLRREPLSTRRAVMEKSIGSSKTLVPSHSLGSNGVAAFGIAKRRGYEGLVAKNLSSPYVGVRSTEWLKVKIHQEDEFVICGYTKPAGSRQYFGALLLGAYEGGRLHYVGKVGTGFDAKTLAALYQRFQTLVTSQSGL